MTAAVSGGDLRIVRSDQIPESAACIAFCARCGLREWSIPEMTLVYFYVLVCRVLMDRLDQWAGQRPDTSAKTALPRTAG
jgi:hypothetical protein